MAVVNHKNRVIQLKIVYYGPGRAGKTSSLEYLQEKLIKRADVKMIQLKSPEERTLFFDFYPIKVGKVRGYDIRVQIYSVPGQERLQALRKLILRGVDGIVFVADAMALRRKPNVESFKNMIENLQSFGKNLSNIPFIIQLNKTDLAENQIPVISSDTLIFDLRREIKDRRLFEGVPVYETSACNGKNIQKGLETIIKETIKRVDFNSLSEVYQKRSNIGYAS